MEQTDRNNENENNLQVMTQNIKATRNKKRVIERAGKRWTTTVYRSRHRGHQRLPSAEEEGAGKNDRKKRRDR